MKSLRADIRQFDKDRKWDSYHSPKNLSMALIVECAELVEIFQWMTEKESLSTFFPGEKMGDLQDEIGDIQIYLTMIADKFNLCPVEMAQRKLEKNKVKYPLTFPE